MPGHGTIYWNELMTADVEASKAFYAAAIGWTYTAMPTSEGTYWLIQAAGQEAPAGGMMQFSGEAGAPTNLWFTYLHVDDLDRALDSARSAGGQVLREPFEVPGVGRIAIVMDSTGAVLGWMTPAAA